MKEVMEFERSFLMDKIQRRNMNRGKKLLEIIILTWMKVMQMAFNKVNKINPEKLL